MSQKDTPKQTIITQSDLVSEANTFKRSTPFSDQQSLQKKIRETKTFIRSYRDFLIITVIANAFGTFIFYSSLTYLKNIIKVSSAEYSQYDTFYSLPHIFKPVYGWITDCFYPFGYRIKSYVTLMSVIHVSLYTFIIITGPSYLGFTVCLTLIHGSDIFINSMAEGATVIKTKLEAKLYRLEDTYISLYGGVHDTDEDEDHRKVLDEAQERMTESEKDQKNMKNFGFFTVFQRALYSTMMILAGWITDHFNISISFVLANFGSVFLIIYVAFFFKEKKAKRALLGRKEITSGFKTFMKIMIAPKMFFPFILFALLTCIPYLYNASYYILQNKAGWSNTLIGVVDALYSYVNTIIVTLILNQKKGISLTRMFLLAVIFLGASQVLLTFAVLPDSFNFITGVVAMTLVYGFFYSSNQLSQIPLVGKISQKLPEGFESSGTNLITGVTKMFTSIGKWLAAVELQAMDVGNGYYERIKSPLIYNIIYITGLSLIAPLLLMSRTARFQKNGRKASDG